MRYNRNAVMGLILACSVLLGTGACGPTPDYHAASPSPDRSVDSESDKLELSLACREYSEDGRVIKDENGEAKFLRIEAYKDAWKKPMPLSCMAQGKLPEPTSREKVALRSVRAIDDDTDHDMGLRRVLAECASTTGYPIDGRSETGTDPEANPFTGPQDAKDGYKVLAFCPDHPQAARIKENADQASMQARQGPDVLEVYEAALAKARDYSDRMHMSRKGIHEELTGKHRERFTPAATQYAMNHLHADYKANALAKAREYRKIMHMSPTNIKNQLTSEYGERFTHDEADYAIQHLND